MVSSFEGQRLHATSGQQLCHIKAGQCFPDGLVWLACDQSSCLSQASSASRLECDENFADLKLQARAHSAGFVLASDLICRCALADRSKRQP